MESELITRIIAPNNWLLIPVLASLVLLVVLKNKKRSNLFLIKSIFSYHDFKQLNKEQHNQSFNALKFFTVVLLMSVLISVLLYQQVSFVLFIKSFFTVALCFFGYLLISKSLGYLFENQSLFKENITYFTHFILTISIISITIISYLIISKNNISYAVFLAYLLVVFVLYIIRLFTLYTTGRQQRFLLIHLILYLCTLEILPVLIVYVLLQGK